MYAELNSFLYQAFAVIPGRVRETAMLGGGALRSFFDTTPVKDYDLFFPSMDEFQKAVNTLRADCYFTEVTAAGEQSFPSFVARGLGGERMTFNLIGFRFHRNLEALARSFDFTCVAHAASWPADGPLVIWSLDGAQRDAQDRVLRFQNKQTYGRAVRRSRRYTDDYRYLPSDGFLADLESCRFVTPTPGDPDY